MQQGFLVTFFKKSEKSSIEGDVATVKSGGG
jgi:hypothetical protein